jgi:meso-butanediol dehydrogenase/(S,S)-butanediol dehydrogenase/diacetyl reductase
MILQNRVVLITGAGQGIGRGIAQAVGEEGGRVIATDLDESSADETAGLIEEAGGRALAVVADVTDSKAIAGAIDRAVETFGRLDGLVNNAGVLRMGSVLETTADDWQHQFQVNVQALGECCRLVAKQMIAQGEGGSIVNVASNAGKVGYPNMAVYNATKAAVISLTRSLSAEWAENEINVNAVCPGGVDTPMLEKVAEWVGPRIGADPGELHSTMTPAQLGRHIQPIEVGRVVAFLLSERATIIRGQSINVDGGDTPY